MVYLIWSVKCTRNERLRPRHVKLDAHIQIYQEKTSWLTNDISIQESLSISMNTKTYKRGEFSMHYKREEIWPIYT